jgi:hypothetical protein
MIALEAIPNPTWDSACTEMGQCHKSVMVSALNGGM